MHILDVRKKDSCYPKNLLHGIMTADWIEMKANGESKQQERHH